MLRVIRTAAAATALTCCLAIAAQGSTANGDRQTRGTVTYKKCGAFRFKGKHALFAHRYPCAKAERKARYVLRHRRRPPHWKCSLSELSSGFAACHRGRHRWEFVPG